MADDWNALENDQEADEQQAKDEVQLQSELDNIDKLMHDLVSKNKKALDFLFTKYVIDAPLETDAVYIHRGQGKVELLRWIYQRAEISQTRATQAQQTKTAL